MITGILSRSLLLIGLGWLLDQKGKPVITLFQKGFDLASIVMLLGGLFLIYKSVKEIHGKLEGEDPNHTTKTKKKQHGFPRPSVPPHLARLQETASRGREKRPFDGEKYHSHRTQCLRKNHRSQNHTD
jgi:hypothetical protein